MKTFREFRTSEYVIPDDALVQIDETWCVLMAELKRLAREHLLKPMEEIHPKEEKKSLEKQLRESYEANQPAYEVMLKMAAEIDKLKEGKK